MTDNRNQVISLISRIDSLTSVYLKNKLEKQGISGIVSSHGFILHLLTLHKKLTMGEISKLINRDKSTTTALIKKLEQGGFLRKVTCKSDSRVRYIMLTPAGLKLTATTADISKELINTAYKNFSDSEKTELYTLLLKLEENFKNS
ncbi:MAG: hypothetical protein BKP49_04040 [Treponema sp. CETP13]|nr:MAG: hypothetical protein BKP49_04040 [Treponema sp. CETP13]